MKLSNKNPDFINENDLYVFPQSFNLILGYRL